MYIYQTIIFGMGIQSNTIPNIIYQSIYFLLVLDGDLHTIHTSLLFSMLPYMDHMEVHTKHIMVKFFYTHSKMGLTVCHDTGLFVYNPYIRTRYLEEVPSNLDHSHISVIISHQFACIYDSFMLSNVIDHFLRK